MSGSVFRWRNSCNVRTQFHIELLVGNDLRYVLRRESQYKSDLASSPVCLREIFGVWPGGRARMAAQSDLSNDRVRRDASFYRHFSMRFRGTFGCDELRGKLLLEEYTRYLKLC